MKVSRLTSADLDPNSPVTVRGTSSTLVLAFGARGDLADGDLHRRLRTSFPGSVIAGCSTAGHFDGTSLLDSEIVAFALEFESATLRTKTAPMTAATDSHRAGEALGQSVAAPDLRAVLILSDGITCNGTALVDGLTSVLPPEVLVFGGLAADDDRFAETIVMDNDGFGPGRVVAVGFCGDGLVFGSGSQGGWDRFGPERTITAASGSVLQGLDGEPALDLYKRYLDDRAAELPGSALLFPLAIRPPDSDYERHVVRTVLGIDEDSNSMTFAGDMPVGWRAQLMRASFDALIDGAADSAEMALTAEPIVGDTLCLAVSCVGRRLVLGSRAEDELDAVFDVIGTDVSLVGYYSYGELGIGLSGGCELHNQTMTLALIGER